MLPLSRISHVCGLVLFRLLSRFIDATGKPWTKPVPANPQALASDESVEVFKAVDARLHIGSNTYPLVEIV